MFTNFRRRQPAHLGRREDGSNACRLAQVSNTVQMGPTLSTNAAQMNLLHFKVLLFQAVERKRRPPVLDFDAGQGAETRG